MCAARVNSFEKLYSPLPLEERDFDAAAGRQKAAPGEGLNRIRYLVRPRAHFQQNTTALVTERKKYPRMRC